MVNFKFESQIGFCSDDLDFGSLTAFDSQQTRKKGNGDVDEVIISVLIRQRSPRASDP